MSEGNLTTGETKRMFTRLTGEVLTTGETKQVLGPQEEKSGVKFSRVLASRGLEEQTR